MQTCNSTYGILASGGLGATCLEMIWPQYLNERTQDLQQVYHDAGQWYWFKTKELTDSFLSGKTAIIKLDETEVHDIDNLSDWKIAELKYKILC